MGWFSDAIGVVTDVFTGGGGSSWIGPVVQAGAEIYGAYSQAEAQRDAANRITQGYDRQAAAIAAGNLAAQDRLDASNQAAQDRLGTITAGAQPATDYLRRVIAQDPYQMTPGQATAHEDALRDARNRVASGGLRGAGRAGAAVVNEASRRFTDRATSQNIARGDTAARQLSGQGYGATVAGAGFDVQTGSRGAAFDASTGQAAGAAAIGGANVGAQADVENAALKGSVIGTLSSFIANDQKERANESKYKEWKSQQGEV